MLIQEDSGEDRFCVQEWQFIWNMLCLHGNIKYAVRYKNLEFKREVQVEDINLKIVNIAMVLKTMKLNNVNKELSVQRKEK